MKILHLSTSRNGGAGRAAWRIHEALLRADIDSQFVELNAESHSLKGFEKNHYSIKAKIQWRLKTHFGIYLDPRERLLHKLPEPFPQIECEIATVPIYAKRISSLPVFNDADIIHLHWVAQGFDYHDFFENARQKIVWTMHDMNPIQGLFHYNHDAITNKPTFGNLDRRVQDYKRKEIQKVSKNLQVVAPSKWLQEEIIGYRLFNKDYISLIPYPIDLKVFKPDSGSAKEVLHLPHDKVLLLAVADYTGIYRKGFDLLIEAIKEMNNVHLVLIGSKPDRIVEASNITYTGKINNDEYLSQLYSAADATVIPSREDNLPNVMLESLACGTPVISFKVGGMVDHIRNFKTGMFAQEMSADSLTDTIRKFIHHIRVFDRNAIRKYAEEHFEPASIARQYMDVYQNMKS